MNHTPTLHVRLILLLCFYAPSLLAQDGVTIEQELAEEPTPATDALFPTPLEPLLDSWEQFKRDVEDATRFQFGLDYNVIYQVSPDLDEPNDTAVGTLNLVGLWRLIDNPTLGVGELGFQFRQRGHFTDANGNEFSANIGSPWSTNDSSSDSFTSLRKLWWSQHLFDERLTVTVGKLDPEDYYDANAASSGNTLFLNQVLSINPNRSFPGPGLGLNAKVVPEDWFYFTAGFSDANGSSSSFGASTFNEGQFFVAGEVGLTPDFEGVGQGNYRFTVWYIDRHIADDSDNTDQRVAGTGFALSFDQQIGDHLMPFFRYGIDDGRVGTVEQFASGGVVFTRPFDRADDAFGIGFGWGRPTSRGGFRDQSVLEVFYRLQATRSLQFTPGVQFIFDPAANTNQDLVTVFTLRARLEF